MLENRRGQVVGGEVKASSTVRAEDFRGLRHLAQRLGDDFLVGIILYTGEQTLPFGSRLRAMPVSALWQSAPYERNHEAQVTGLISTSRSYNHDAS